MVAEDFVDRLASSQELWEFNSALIQRGSSEDCPDDSDFSVLEIPEPDEVVVATTFLNLSPVLVAENAVGVVQVSKKLPDKYAAMNAEIDAQTHSLRDIFGPVPFRPVSPSPAWVTPTVTGLAQSIYEERNFADLPILADALEEAGCSDPEILGHLRSPGPHCLGCWALDLVLGKE